MESVAIKVTAWMITIIIWKCFVDLVTYAFHIPFDVTWIQALVVASVWTLGIKVLRNIFGGKQ